MVKLHKNESLRMLLFFIRTEQNHYKNTKISFNCKNKHSRDKHPLSNPPPFIKTVSAKPSYGVGVGGGGCYSFSSYFTGHQTGKFTGTD